MAQRRRFALLKQTTGLGSLGDVNITGASAGQLLEFDGSVWTNVDFGDLADFAEAVDDRVAALMVAGNNIDVTYDDVSNTFTIDVEGLTSADIGDFAEAVDDRVGSLLVAGTNVTLTYNDGANTLTIDAAGGGDVSTDALWDAAGDLVVGSGANTAARLAVGAEGEVLTVVSGVPTWAASAGGSGGTIRGDSARVVRSTSQTITAATYTAVSWSSESWDTGAMWDSGNPTRLVAPRAGKYMVGANLNFGSGTATNGLGCWWTKNGQSPASSSAYRRGGQWFAAGQDSTEFTTEHVLELAAGDYVELWIYSVNGTTLETTGDAEGSVAWMIELAVGASDPLELSDRATPTSPPAGAVTLYSHDLGNVGLPAFLFPGMSPAMVLLSTAQKSWTLTSDGNTQVLQNYGGPTYTGTIAAGPGSMTGSNLLEFHTHWKFTSSAAANSQAGFRFTSTSNLGFYRNYTTNANVGGAFMRLRFAYDNALSTAKHFFGLASGATNVGMGSGVSPSAILNCIGVGKDEGDTNLHFMHNDGSGTCTQVDLGITAASVTASLLDLYIQLERNGDARVSLVNLENGNSYSATITTDLPADNTLLFPKGYSGNGATATAVVVRVYAMQAIDQIGDF